MLFIIAFVGGRLLNRFFITPILLRTETLKHGEEGMVAVRNTFVNCKFTTGAYQFTLQYQFVIFGVPDKWQSFTGCTNQEGSFQITKKQQKIGDRIYTYHLRGKIKKGFRLPYIHLSLN